MTQRYFTFPAAFLLIVFGLHISNDSSWASSSQDATLRVLLTSDEDGNPVIGATVTLSEPDADEFLHAGTTNNDGFLELSGIETGDYQLQISYIGYETYTDEISLTADDLKVERITLKPDPGELDEIIIQEERRVTTGQVGVRSISGTEVERVPTPGPGGDLASYIQTLPGVVMSGDRGGELHIRGGTPAQNHVRVDNLPITKPFHISNLFSAFPDETIQNVDMYAGGFGAEYMGATSSVIDVSLRPGNMREYRGSAAYSPYLVSLMGEGPIQEDRQSLMVMGRHSVIEQSAPHLTGEDVPIEFYDVMARYSLQTDIMNCNATGMHTSDRGEINPDRDIQLAWTNTVIGARCLGFDEMFDQPFDITLGYSGFQNIEGTMDDPERSSSIHQVFFQLIHEHTYFGLPFDYHLGLNFASYSAELGERFTTFENFDLYPMLVQTGLSTDLTPFDELTIRPSIGTQITSQNVSEPSFEPRLRISYQPDGTSNQELSFAVGRYHQFVSGITDERDAGNVFTVWSPIDRGDPLPGATHYILGYEQRIGQSFRANLEGYYKDHQNIPVSKWTPEARLSLETTLAEGHTYGVDARVEYDRFPFFFYVGYGWGRVEYEATSEDLGAWIEEPVFGYNPAHDRRHQLNAVGSYNLYGYTLNVRWEFGSGNPYTQVYGYDLSLTLPDQHPLRDSGTAMTLYNEPYGARLPSYHSLDISLERTFQLSAITSLDAQIGTINVYDRNNIFYYDLNSLQRIDQTPLLPYASMQINFN